MTGRHYSKSMYHGIFKVLLHMQQKQSSNIHKYMQVYIFTLKCNYVSKWILTISLHVKRVFCLKTTITKP